MGENIEKEKPAIYSKWAILGFCMFFSPIFGGVLLRQNLIDIDKKTEGNMVLFVSILMAIFAAAIASMPFGGFGVTAVVNFIQGAVLVEYNFKRHFPDETQFEKKAIRKPLAISMFVVLLMMFLLILSGGPMPTK